MLLVPRKLWRDFYTEATTDLRSIALWRVTAEQCYSRCPLPATTSMWRRIRRSSEVLGGSIPPQACSGWLPHCSNAPRCIEACKDNVRDASYVHSSKDAKHNVCTRVLTMTRSRNNIILRTITRILCKVYSLPRTPRTSGLPPRGTQRDLRSIV